MILYPNYMLFILLALPGLLLGFYARRKVNKAFKQYAKVPTARHLTGAQVARRLLDEQGLSDVIVEESQGFLSDHYDPRHRVLRLSKDVYSQPSVSAAGIAAHEMGHALQHQAGYWPLQARSAIVPAAQFGSRLAPMLVMAGLFMSFFIGGTLGVTIAWIGVALFGAAVVFTLITLPVEFDATRRAKRLLVSSGTLIGNEIEGVNKVLDAAALTYVAAAIAAVGQLLYYVLMLTGGGRRR